MRIGVTGHRPNRLHVGEARVGARLRETLTALRDATRSRDAVAPLIAVSALAEGADRLFAETALDLGFTLHAILPFTSTDYETTFGDANTTPTYRALLARAAHISILPGSLFDSDAAYEAQGRTIVDHSNLVIAVWDGKPAAGRGGTPEIIEYAITQLRPVIWVDAAQDRPPVLLTRLDAQPQTEPLCPSKIQDIIAAASRQ